MSCTVLTAERLQRALSSQLTDEERALLQTHFADPCDACLALLEGADAEALITALAGPGGELTRSEAERVFAVAVRVAPAAAPSRWEQWRAWFAVSPWRPAMAMAAVLAVLLAPALWLARVQPGADWDGLKGSPQVPQVGLAAFVGAPGASGDQVQRYQPGAAIAAGQVLMFRRSASAPAHLALVDARSHEVLWRSGVAVQGEAELAEGGKVLALDPAQYPHGVTLRLVGCKEPVEDSRLSSAASCGRAEVVVGEGGAP